MKGRFDKRKRTLLIQKGSALPVGRWLRSAAVLPVGFSDPQTHSLPIKLAVPVCSLVKRRQLCHFQVSTFFMFLSGLFSILRIVWTRVILVLSDGCLRLPKVLGFKNASVLRCSLHNGFTAMHGICCCIALPSGVAYCQFCEL